MEEKKAHIRRELEAVFREWSARAAFAGAVIFLLLSPLDFYAVPAHATRFLFYRLGIAALLTASGAFLRRPRSRAAARATVSLCVVASAAALVAMILSFGGHESPYLIGLILLAVTVLGLIPAGPALASVLAGAIFAIYLGPILASHTFDEPLPFAVRTFLFATVLATGVFINWLHVRRLEDDIGLRYDLTRSRERVEREAVRREQIATELRNSQELLSSLAVAAMDAIVMFDPEGTIRYWNPAAVRMFGHSEAEAVGSEVFALIAGPGEAGELAVQHRSWLEAGERRPSGRRVVGRGRRKGGESFPVELTATAVEREGRLWTCAFLRDVTERVRGEERLRLFAAAVEGAAEGFYIVGLEGRILYVNPAVQAISGREPSWYLGRSITELHANPAQATGAIIPAIMRSGSWSGEVPGRTADGRPLAIWLTASVVRDEAGHPIAMVGIANDLSERKRLEEERIRAQKLESIGVLAGGLAHDFNNLLTIILGNLDLARIQAGTNPEAAEALDHAGEAALRAGDLTRQLITFSKGGHPVKRVGEIGRILRETVVFVAAGSNIECVFELSADLPPVEFDEGQMRQVIHNIVQNAREAMPAGGELRVRAGTAVVKEAEIVGLRPGRYVLLQFRDRGSGIDRAHLSLVFDPYFSTKEMDSVKGRGLGLAVSFSIVRNHGGTMTAASSAAEGTTISIYLPEAPHAPDATAGVGRGPEAAPAQAVSAEREDSPPDSTAACRGKGRVLVMDDEPLVLEMAGAVLRRLGYSPTLARSAAEAIVQYQIGLDAQRRFDAVILDLTVAGGPGGPETLARLREIDPTVRAALSTGHVDHPVVADWAGAGFAALIPKPYSIKSFEEALARLL